MHPHPHERSRTSRRALLPASVMLGVAFVATSCQPGSPLPGAPLGPTVSMKWGQAHLTPAAVVGALSTQQASKRAQQEAGLSADRSPDELTTGVFTDDTLTKMGPGGAMRLIDHRKVYVAAFKGVPVMATGAPGAPRSRPIHRNPSIGTVTVVMDASTGSMLEQLTEGN